VSDGIREVLLFYHVWGKSKFSEMFLATLGIQLVYIDKTEGYMYQV
jgi:hypothetical protein